VKSTELPNSGRVTNGLREPNRRYPAGVQPNDEYDIVSDALDRLSARNLTAGYISGLRLDNRPTGEEFVVVELWSERRAQFGQAITDALGEIPHEFHDVPPGHGILYSRGSTRSSLWSRWRETRRRRKIVRQHARGI
jgi:hypothetical protein